MNRGANRQPIFLEAERDRHIFLATLQQAVALWKIKIHAFSLMDNHYHLLIETPLANLSRAMRHIDGVYTQRLNRLVQRDGPLLRGRFKSILVQKDSYFLELIRYIHMNGVKAGKYSTPENDPNGSHREYVRAKSAMSWLSLDLALSYFHPDPVIGRRQLHEFVMKGVPQSIDNVLANSRWPAILGEKVFVGEIRERFRLGKPPHPEKPQEISMMKMLSKSPEEALRIVQKTYRVTQGELISRCRHRTVEARRAAMFALRFASHLNYEQIGKMLGGVRSPAVSHGIKKIQSIKTPQFMEVIQSLS
jgi:REP element-mobilizing transposase RayT